MGELHTIDLIAVAGYLLAVLTVAWWATTKKSTGSTAFFLADRDMGWIAVGASLFVSNIGSEHLVGLAGTGAASGLAVGHFEWLASLILLLLGWLFVPFYLRSGVFTILAYRWLYTILLNATRYNSAVTEKYDVTRRRFDVDVAYGNVGRDFELFPPGGFGWTNASFQVGLTMLDGDRREALGRLVPPEWLEDGAFTWEKNLIVPTDRTGDFLCVGPLRMTRDRITIVARSEREP